MIYILVALKGELPEHKLDKTKYKVYYTGVGKVNAALFATLSATQDDCEFIINYGTAGVLNKNLVDKLNRVSTVIQRDMDARPQADLGITPFEETGLQGPIELTTDGVILSTGDNFVTEKPELESDLVDMEGYAIAKVAKHFKKPCIMVKYGSDFADEKAPSEWEANQSKGADMFVKFLNTLEENNSE